MANPRGAKLTHFMDDPIALAIERERHSLLGETCEESELFVDIERLMRSMPNQAQRTIAITDQNDVAKSHQDR